MYLTREISGILQNYIIGQIILCVIAGVLTGIVLNFLNMPYTLVLAVFAGITRAIPIIGPIISGIPICIVGYQESPSLGVALLIFVIVMHFAESKFIMPILIGDRMKLHPAVVLAVLLIGAELFGVIGMFLAAPVTAIIRELVYFYIIRPQRAKPTPKERIDDLPSPLVRSGSV
jgi:predicted PurR-regulated permease PerM